MSSGTTSALGFASGLVLIALAVSGCGKPSANNAPRQATNTGNQSMEGAQAEEAKQLAKKCRKILEVVAPSDPARDILGVYPGMKAEDATLMLRCRIKNAEVQTGKSEINYAPGKNSQTGYIAITGTSDVVGEDGRAITELKEFIRFGIAGSVGDEKVLFISREVTYDPSKPKPKLKEVLDAFASKYGELSAPIGEESLGVFSDAVISHSRSGQRIGPSSSLFEYCGKSDVYVNASSGREPGVCGLTIKYRITTFSDGVSKISTRIDNPANTSAQIAAAGSSSRQEASLPPNL